MVQADTNEMDMANHNDETKWLLPAYMVDRPQQLEYSQVSKNTAFKTDKSTFREMAGLPEQGGALPNFCQLSPSMPKNHRRNFPPIFPFY
jgi:hypothetical protein